MRRYVLVLVIGSGAVAIVLGTWFAFYLPQPELRADIRFEPLRPAYIVGEEVLVELENRGDLRLCTHIIWPWTVFRLVASEWQRVDSHSSLSAFSSIEPGETLEILWPARNSEFYPKDGTAEVLPGEYRMRFTGWFCESSSFDRIDPGFVELFAYFEVVA